VEAEIAVTLGMETNIAGSCRVGKNREGFPRK